MIDNSIPSGLLTLPILRRVPGLRHGFTTRLSGTGRLEGEALARRIGLGRFPPVPLTQVHGDQIVVVREKSPRSPQTEADAVATDLRRTLLLIRTADCVPILLVDPDHGAIAACHAGWRGISLGIARIGVETLVREFRSAPARILAGIGPAIGECCYQVGEEVRESFHSNGQEPAEGEFLEDRDGRLRLNLRLAVVRQLRQAGVPGDRIQSLGLCTACHPDWFYSRRRDGAGPDRLHAFLAWESGSGYP
ncbi:MAG: peptidoglycan editing factor PgeF [Acidobacteriota bacterium]